MVVAVRAPHRRSRLRVRDWRVRTKLGVVLVIPTLALLAVGGVQVQTQVDKATQLDDFASQVSLGRQVSALIQALQGERDRTVGDVAAFEAVGRGRGPGKPGPDLREFRAAVDRAVAALNRAGASVSGGSAWQAAYERVPRRLEALPATRAGVDNGNLPSRFAHDVYGRTIETLLNLLALPDAGPDHDDLARQRDGYVELARIRELDSQMRSRIFALGRAAEFVPGAFVEITDLQARRQTALVQFRASAPADLVNQYDVVVRGPIQLRQTQLEQQVFDSGGRASLRLDAAQWWQTSSEQLNRIRGMEIKLISDATAEAGERSAGQLRRTGLVAAALTLVVLIAMVVSLLIGRSMARSLRVLRSEALQVAQTELPQVLQRLADVRAGRVAPDISVRSRTVRSADEIGEVAEAFTAVHASAVSLALEQAAMRRNVNTMFVNLARRSQVLVERQLELLDQLESREGDPDVLANLFRLDHLAARMRRNDESLLVLAGNENARRWRNPIALSAAMLAAIAEIEQYPRVRHNSDDTWHIVGHAAADVVHLFAELLENATAFSPPGTAVRISGEVVGDHVLVEITDEGIGMSPGAIESANALLESPPAADVAASERMGLFVVSHLAARHGVRVRLRTVGRGVIASVWLPPDLLAQPAPEVLTPSEVLGPRDMRGPAVAARVPRPAVGGVPAVAAGRVPVGVGRAQFSGMRPMPPMDLVLTGRRVAAAVARIPAQRTPSFGPTGRLRRTGDPGSASAWWSRDASAAAPLTGGAAAPAPPEVPVTGGLTERGLPVRVPMAQLPPEEVEVRVDGNGVGSVPPKRPAAEPDPDDVGSTLARFYGGVRRAEAEETVQNPAVPAGPRWQKEQP
jgi:hypothetical protein